MPIFRVKSVKIYTGQKKLTRTSSVRPWQIWGMLRWLESLLPVWSRLGSRCSSLNHYRRHQRSWHSCFSFFLLKKYQGPHYRRTQDQAPAGSRNISGSRDFFKIPIPGFSKIWSRDFSGSPEPRKRLRLSTPFINHNNLFWDLKSLQEGHFLSFWFFCNQYSTWTNSHWFSDAKRNQSINQTFTSHLFRKPMSLNRPRLDLTITQASTFSGVRQALFLGHNVASNIEHRLALAA